MEKESGMNVGESETFAARSFGQNIGSTAGTNMLGAPFSTGEMTIGNKPPAETATAEPKGIVLEMILVDRIKLRATPLVSLMTLFLSFSFSIHQKLIYR
jgi:hypothetical protein